MTNHRLQGMGVHVLAAIALAGLTASTPGLALITDAAPLPAPMPDQAAALVTPDAEPAEPEAAQETPEAVHIGDGEASYYGHELAGNRTASGERFNPRALTAAHRTLPLGTRLRVTNKANGKSVVVRINDRGPFVKKRLIDVSLAAAQQISMVRAGKALVRLELLR